MNATTDTARTETSEPGSAANEAEVPPEPEAGSPVPLTILVDPALARHDVALDIAWLQQNLTATFAQLPQPVERVAVRLVDDVVMAELHHRHLDIDGPTDVLTFASSGPTEPVDVDLAIGVLEAARVAEHQPHDVTAEVLLYCLHGLLHVLGFDDHAESDFDRMHAREDEILRAIGVGALFGTEGRS